MQTHDEGEPWRDYVPPSPRPTADPLLAKMQYDYTALHRAASEIVQVWREARHLVNPYVALKIDKPLYRMAQLLREEQYP